MACPLPRPRGPRCSPALCPLLLEPLQVQKAEMVHAAQLAQVDALSEAEAERMAILGELAVLYNNHGTSLKKLGDTEKALAMFNHSLEVHGRINGEDSLDIVPVLINIGAAHMALGDPFTAEPNFAKGHSIRLAQLGAENPQTVSAGKWLYKCMGATQGKDAGRTPSTSWMPSGSEETDRGGGA